MFDTLFKFKKILNAHNSKKNENWNEEKKINTARIFITCDGQNSAFPFPSCQLPISSAIINRDVMVDIQWYMLYTLCFFMTAPLTIKGDYYGRKNDTIIQNESLISCNKQLHMHF